MMATIKPLGAIFVFMVTWGIWAGFIFSAAGVELFAATIVLLPIYLFALIALVERLTLLFGAIRSLARSVSINKVYEQVHDDREAVVEAVAQAV